MNEEFAQAHYDLVSYLASSAGADVAVQQIVAQRRVFFDAGFLSGQAAQKKLDAEIARRHAWMNQHDEVSHELCNDIVKAIEGGE